MSDEKNLGADAAAVGNAGSIAPDAASHAEPLHQFTGPQGAFYMRPSAVAVLGHAQHNPFSEDGDDPGRLARFISTHGGFGVWIWDEPGNMARLLR